MDGDAWSRGAGAGEGAPKDATGRRRGMREGKWGLGGRGGEGDDIPEGGGGLMPEDVVGSRHFPLLRVQGPPFHEAGEDGG